MLARTHMLQMLKSKGQDDSTFGWYVYIQLFQKRVVIVSSRYWNRISGTLGTVTISNNAPAKVVTV